MPKRFMWRGADVYIPMTFERGHPIEGVRVVHLLGRLKPGVSDTQAEADLGPIIADLKARQAAEFPDRWRVGLLSFAETFPSGIQGDVWVLFGAVGVLLLIACVNVSNLLLSRASVRQREMSVRAALGASRARLVRQLLAESSLLALAAAALGAALAYAGLPAILALVPPNTIPDESEVVLNRSVLGFTLVIAGLTSILCGLAPALHSSGRDLANRLREAGRGLAGSSRQAVVRKSLVVFEVALALMLLAGASLLVRTFVTMRNVDLGFSPDRLLTLRVPLPARRYPEPARKVAFFRELLDRLSALPGVTAAGLNTGLHPLGNMRVAADVVGTPASTNPVEVHQIGGTYTAALDIRLVSGRLLGASELNTAQHVALVNQRFVMTRLDGRPPLGQIVRLPRLRQPPFSVGDDAFQIVGVVHDVLNEGLANPVIPEIYIPYSAAGVADLVVVRTPADAASLMRAVTAQVYAIDPNQPVHEMKTLDVVLRENEYATPRFNLTLLSIFAVMGLALALVGVYGVMSTAVAQQKHEIGVRMALGANTGSITRLVLTRGARLLIVGMMLGLAGSLVVARVLARQVWNVSPFDPLAFVVVSLILLAAGLQACILPALRAARIDPIIALRQDEH
jgi:predicted permease